MALYQKSSAAKKNIQINLYPFMYLGSETNTKISSPRNYQRRANRKWTIDDNNYAKRQMVWFKTNSDSLV
jgi:tRNA A37 N6-isopentenylltransferase MiaA